MIVMTRTLPGLLALLFTAPWGFAQDGVIVTADNRSITAKSIRITPKGDGLTLSFQDNGGKEQTLSADEVVELVLGSRRVKPAEEPVPEDIKVVRSTGDIFLGKVGAASGTGIRLKSPVWGERVILFEQLHAVLFPVNLHALPTEPPSQIDADVILRKSGDRGEGTLMGISSGGVTYKSRRLDRNETVALADTAGVWLVEIEAPPKPPGDLYSLVLTRDGSSIQGRIQTLESGVLSIQDLYGQTLKIAAGHVSAIYMKNGRVVYLSDLDPSDRQEDANFIRSTRPLPSDLEYPFRRDRRPRLQSRRDLGGRRGRLLGQLSGTGTPRIPRVGNEADGGEGLGVERT